jgi:hypothetical protein
MDNCLIELIDCANNLMYLKTQIIHKHSKKQCEICYATYSPAWRRAGKYNILCNRCGIRERNKILKKY